MRKQFGSLKVLDGIDFTAQRRELLSLVGPNGAGKTTLMRCIADGGERSGGTVLINDHDIERLPPYSCVAFGVGRKFQTANVFDTLTVARGVAHRAHPAGAAVAVAAVRSRWRCRRRACR